MHILNQLKEGKNFSYIDQCIASYLLENQESMENSSARYIARQIHTSPSTVVRFAQKLGYEGFNDFKKDFMKEYTYLQTHFSEINPNYPFDFNDKNVLIASKMGQLYQEQIKDVLTLIEHDRLQAVINILKKAKTIYVVSSGVQLDVAKTFKDKMLKIGKSVIIEDKINEVFYQASFCDEESAFIFISYSGETEPLLRVAKKVKERNLSSIAITSYGTNTLLEYVNEVLYVSTREKLITNLGDFGMNLSTLFLLDVVYANIFNDSYKINFENKTTVSKEFEKFRKSNNPILNE